MTAKALLQKGDAAGAAKAMGMTLQEFFTYTNNAMLSIPTKTDQKELSPEQKKAQQEAQLRAAERKEIEDLKSEYRTNPKRLEQFGYKVYSQNDEDGILSEIFKRIGVERGVFFEIGPGKVLKGLLRRINPDLVVYNIETSEDIKKMSLAT